MATLELMKQIVAVYQRHGWHLRRVLLRLEMMQEATAEAAELFGAAQLHEADFDALWFARPSRAQREAWELRLISDQPYALFEAFDADESEDDREAARSEMEDRMRAYANPARS